MYVGETGKKNIKPCEQYIKNYYYYYLQFYSLKNQFFILLFKNIHMLCFVVVIMIIIARVSPIYTIREYLHGVRI